MLPFQEQQRVARSILLKDANCVGGLARQGLADLSWLAFDHTVLDGNLTYDGFGNMTS